MEQHPIPQNISSYQFRLVGDMTLKQFLELAGGGLIAFVFYKSGLPDIFRWPLAVIFGLGGVTFAFFPFEERPLDIWLINFFKSIYSPTIYLWKKHPKLPDFFSFEPTHEKTASVKRLTPEERLRFTEYLNSLPKEPSRSLLDQQEEKELTQINHYLTIQTGLNPRVNSSLTSSSTSLNTLPSVKVRKLKSETEVKKVPLPTAQPATPMVKFAVPFTPPIEIGTPFKSPEPPPKPPKPIVVKPTKKELKILKAMNVPLPTAPDIPNVVVGMVFDSENKILPNAIIEIRDSSGMPVRASKSNKVGQFFIVTPLPEGDYEIEVEYPTLRFDIIKFKAEGKLIPPIRIQAKAINNSIGQLNNNPVIPQNAELKTNQNLAFN